MLVRRSISAAVISLALVGSSARTALANMAAPVRDPGRLTSPRMDAKTPLVVEEERLSFQCQEVSRVPSCSFEARYRVFNPSAEPSGGHAAFYGLHADGVEVKVDGRHANVNLTADEVKALDEDVAAASGSSQQSTFWNRMSMATDRQGFALTVQPGARVEVVATGSMVPGQTIYGHGYSYNPAEGRHYFLHRGDPERRIHEFEYLVSPIRTWAAVHRMVVTVRYPSSWTMYGSFYGTPQRSEATWVERNDGDFMTSTATTDGKVSPDAMGNVLELRFSLPGDRFEHGGPFVGLGGALGSMDKGEFRMRFGYEMAAPWWLVESLTVDTDFNQRLVLAANAEAALPHLLFVLPSLSVGAGLPVQVLPTPTVGMRFLAGVQFPFLGFSTSVDIFPGLSPQEGRYQVALLGRLSL